jgi:hypothetical protein
MWPNEQGSRAYSDFKTVTCIKSYTGNHSWSRPHFLTRDNRYDWVKFCRRCDAVTTHHLSKDPTGKLIVETVNSQEENADKINAI